MITYNEFYELNKSLQKERIKFIRQSMKVTSEFAMRKILPLYNIESVDFENETVSIPVISSTIAITDLVQHVISQQYCIVNPEILMHWDGWIELKTNMYADLARAIIEQG